MDTPAVRRGRGDIELAGVIRRLADEDRALPVWLGHEEQPEQDLVQLERDPDAVVAQLSSDASRFGAC